MTEVDRHFLIQKEFRISLEQVVPFIPDQETNAVMVLSAPPGKDPNGGFLEETPENLARIKYGIDLIITIVSERCGKPKEDIQPTDLLVGPDLALNGDTTQLAMMQEVAGRLNFPTAKIVPVDAGSRATANTKTQFTALQETGRFTNKKVIIVTSPYHVPRVDRTANAQCPKLSYRVVGIPCEAYDFDVYKTVKGEVRRIGHYAKSGDISAKAKQR